MNVLTGVLTRLEAVVAFVGERIVLLFAFVLRRGRYSKHRRT